MSPEQAYQDGYDARQWDRASLNTNPFDCISQAKLFHAWLDGWIDRENWERRLDSEV